MEMLYDHLPDADLDVQQVVRPTFAMLLPERAQIKAFKRKGNSFAVYVSCSPKLSGELQGEFLRRLRNDFPDAFLEVFHYTMGRKFCVFFDVEKLVRRMPSEEEVERLVQRGHRIAMQKLKGA